MPAAVGVPDSAPDDPRLSPGGSVPETNAHAYGVFPPAAASVCEYAVPVYAS